MAKAVATEESVAAAAQALLAEGKDPSTMLVQERTGGSYTTVKRHLEAWVSKRKNESPAVELPAEIEARGRDFVQALYAQAVHSANATVAEPLAQAVAAREQAESQLVGAEAEVSRLEAVEHDQAARIEALGQQVRELELAKAAQEATLQEKGANMARLESQLAEAQSSLADRDQALAALRASSGATESLQGQIEALQRAIQGLSGGAKAKKD